MHSHLSENEPEPEKLSTKTSQTQGSVLQSSTEHWGAHFALSNVAVHRCLHTVHLYEEQICMSVTAKTQ